MKRTIDLLHRLRAALQSYGDQHLAKDPPQAFKAKVNLTFVAEINEVLVELATPPRPVVPQDVRVPDVLEPGQIIYRENTAMHIPSIVHLTKYVETLKERDEEDYTAIRMRIGDLRVLAGVDGG